ncbi:unnamed protein product [Phaeothamnion confervicola]
MTSPLRHSLPPGASRRVAVSANAAAGARWVSVGTMRARPGATTMGMADALPGPLRGLFGTGGGGGRRSTTSRRSEGAALYRAMGVAEDATYEEIQEAFEALKIKYKGDRKAIVKLEKTKDDIMDLRLRQRMAGTLKVAAEAREVDSAMDAYDARKKKWVMPAWMQGWVILPKDGHAMRMFYYHGMMMAAAVVFPSMASSTTILGMLLCIGTITGRGAPPAKKDEMGQIVEFKMPNKLSMLGAFAIGIAASLAGGALGTFVGYRVGESLILQESWACLGQQSLFLLIDTFVSTYREGRTKGRGGY